MKNVLDVKDLRVEYRGRPIVGGIDFSLAKGESLGLAGESGCGKTTSALALMKLLPDGLRQSGSITLMPDGVEEPINIGKRTEAGMQVVRWRHISLVFQGAMNSLDPVKHIDHQIAEVIRLHEKGVSSGDCRARIADLLTTVGLTPKLGSRYPHQLSGGQRQRVMIALALACRPSVVIADEPTTALDVVMQAQVLELLEKLREELGLALILISHDLGVLAETCDRIAVMYAGRIVETGSVDSVFSEPQHPYTKRLLDSLPVIGGERGLAPPIPGSPPDPATRPKDAHSIRDAPTRRTSAGPRPESRPVGPGHVAACHFSPWSSWPEVRCGRNGGGAVSEALMDVERPRGHLPLPPETLAGTGRDLSRMAAGRGARRGRRVGLRQVHPCPGDAGPAGDLSWRGSARRAGGWRTLSHA